MIKDVIKWKYKYLIVTNSWSESHFTRNSTNFSLQILQKLKNIQEQIQQNSSNSPPKSEILFESISIHLPLKLFWQVASRNLTNLNCFKGAHQWQIAISHNWSILELFYLLQLPSWSIFFICFGLLRAKAQGITAVIKLRCEFESHYFLNWDMVFVVHSLLSMLQFVVFDLVDCRMRYSDF